MANKEKNKEIGIMIIVFVIYAVILFVLKELILTKLGWNGDDWISDVLNKIYTAMIIFAWAATLFVVIRYRKYRRKTGRNLIADSSQYKRGYKELTDYYANADPHKLDNKNFNREIWIDAKGIVLGMSEHRLLTIPSNSECNIAVFGPPGTGKTSGVAIPNAITFNGAVLAIDIKGDLYQYVYHNSNREIIRFCPDDPEAFWKSYCFDPFADIMKMSITDKKLYLESMATILIPEETGTDGYFFSSRARKMFQGIAHLMLYENPQTSFPQLVHAILDGNPFDWVKRAMNSQCTAAREQIASFYGNNEKNVSAIYDTLTTAMVHFSNPTLDHLLSKSEKCISANLLERGYDIYLQVSQEHLESYAPLFTLIIQMLSTEFTKRPDRSTGTHTRPILMLMDEFPQLTFSYEIINRNLSTLRSKNVICMIVQQNLSQLEQRFGQTGARSLLGNCNIQMILGSNDIATSTLFSDLCGYKKVLRRSNSETISSDVSTGVTVHEVSEKVFPIEHFGDLPSRNKLVLYMKGKYLECDKLNCYNYDMV